MTIASLDDLVAAMPGQHRHFNKVSAAGGTVGQWWSLYNVGGNPGAPGAPPSGAGEVPTQASPGNLFSFANPVAPAQTFLAQTDIQIGRGALAVLVDRLWHCSGIVANINTPQTINSLPLTRPDVAGVGTELWLEVYTAATNSRTYTVSYTNSDGTAGRTAAITLGATFPAFAAARFPLAAGDKGVKSVQSITSDTAGGSVGNLGLSIVRRLAVIPAGSIEVNADRDAFMLGFPRVYDDTCFALIVASDSTITGAIAGGVQLVQG